MSALATSIAVRQRTYRPQAPIPLWRLALLSFVPVRHRDRIEALTTHLLLGVVLVLQGICSLRLGNSAFQDEALYIHTGHWIIQSWQTGETVYLHPEKFFSGAPQLYPVFAALLDDLGGLTVVRLFSTLCMLSSTGAVYWTTNQLFANGRVSRRPGQRPGVYAAFVFATSASVVFLGNFATFDAPSFTALAWAAALGVWVARRPVGRSAYTIGVLSVAPLVGALCAFGVLLKYSSAIDVPFVTLLVLVQAVKRRSRLGQVGGFVAGITCIALLGGSALTWAAPLLTGLHNTTTARSALTALPARDLLEQVLTWDGVAIALMLVGALLLLPREPLQAVVLGIGSIAAPAYQIHMGELVSLHKHVVLGLVLGAPLAGYALARLARMPLGRVAAFVVIWCAFLLGMFQSRALYTAWPDTSGLAGRLSYSIAAMPWIRTVGDNPEPMEYAFQDRTKPWQWTATYENSFSYKGLQGVAAYRRALEDNYFQLAFFDEGTPISRQLIPEMASYGFKQTGVVRTAWGAHTWRIYERYEKLD